MSSWANRYIPRKRNLEQIPAELRPQIVPRAQRAEIVISESFQDKPQNTNINFENDNKLKEKEEYINPRQYITKKVDFIVNPTAFELKYNDKSYVFVILRHLRNVRDNDLWISSYNSIRKFYTNKIIIIDDNSEVNTVNGKLVNTEIIYSEAPGAGEILPYYYFLKYMWADRMIFLHDSMFINRPFKNSELDGSIKFHWYFNDNLNDSRKINNYITMLNNGDKIKEFISNPGTKWLACFGATTICDLSMIKYFEEEYKLFSTLIFSIRNRKDREAFERVFGIVLWFEGIFENDECSNFGDILKYPGAFESENNNYETTAYILRQKGYDTAIMKVWRGR